MDPEGKFLFLASLAPAALQSIAYVAATISGVSTAILLDKIINIFNNQDKPLSDGEIEALKKAGVDPHQLKKQLGKGRSDLFKRRNGDICVKPKSGDGPGEDIGYNIKDIMGIK